MNTLRIVYDGTFDGFLTALHRAWQETVAEVSICRSQHNAPAFFETIEKVESNPATASIEWKKIKDKMSSVTVQNIYCCYLSGLPGIENTIWQFLQYAFVSEQNIETDFANKQVLKISQVAKMVHREKHRMEAFVRFRLMKEDLFFASVEPDFDVLPLINDHFTKRYADQRWLIYDLKRKYGLYYDLKETVAMEMTFDEHTENGKRISEFLGDDEKLYEELWKVYFKNVNIPERKNTKLHLRHVPKRYWKYLSEKQPV